MVLKSIFYTLLLSYVYIRKAGNRTTFGTFKASVQLYRNSIRINVRRFIQKADVITKGDRTVLMKNSISVTGGGNVKNKQPMSPPYNADHRGENVNEIPKKANAVFFLFFRERFNWTEIRTSKILGFFFFFSF